VASQPKSSSSNALMLSLVLLGAVLAVMVAASTTVWVLLLPLAGLLGWAWYHGRNSTT
jgi:chromate transport protein ChrA